MDFKIGDYVTRTSHNNDIVFKIIDIRDKVAFLKGIDVRLFADSDLSDLVICSNDSIEDSFTERMTNESILDINDRGDYFYLPAKILHLDIEFQLTNTLANPYKIRKKAIFENCKNHQK